VQIKRLHEYKRQHLNLLHILALYRRLLQNPALDIVPRSSSSGPRPPPATLAKNIIHAINVDRQRASTTTSASAASSRSPSSRTTACRSPSVIIPAADLSEQISTAGKEASGTGNMKLALNGALTIGTLDGANVEIGEEVGDDNIFIFGLTVEEVEALWARGYNPWTIIRREELRAVLDWLGSDYFTPGEHGAFKPLRDSLLHGGDPFLVLADFRLQRLPARGWTPPTATRHAGQKMAIHNTARVGKFSSDRTIREYATSTSDIWG
jgi:starch phosphorylase